MAIYFFDRITIIIAKLFLINIKDVRLSMDTIMEFVRNYGLPAVFLIIMLEYACFPVPSEIVLPFAGAVAVGAGVGFVKILAIATAAGIIGSFICYAIGRFGGVALVNKLIEKFPKMKAGLDYSQRQFDKYAVLSVGFGRVIPLCRTYISFIAGLGKQNPVAFAVSSTIGIITWNSLLVGVGYFFSDNWQIVAVYYEKYKVVVVILGVAVVLAFAAYKFYNYKKDKQS